MGKLKLSEKKTKEALASGTTVELLISTTDSILSIKQQLERKIGADPRRQRLLFKGQKLENEKNAAIYKLQDNDELALVLMERNYHDGS